MNKKKMKIINVKSYNQLTDLMNDKDKSFLLLFKKGSDQSDCAYKNLNDIAEIVHDIQLMCSDVSEVRDIHEHYDIKSVPSLLEFEGMHLKNVIKGCHDPNYFKSIIDEAVYIAKAKKEGRSTKRVVVYTSPTCSWCNTIKSYLRKHNIRFREVDVSKDPAAAQELVKRSGQQGVPQTDINGQIVVGFDQNKLNQLLEINNH